MNRFHTGEEGSLPLALLATIVVAGLVSIVLASVVAGQRQTTFDAQYETSLQSAEGGLERAVVVVTSRALTSTFCLDPSVATTPQPGTCAGGDPAPGSFKVQATKDNRERWVITSTGADGERTRSVQALVEPDTLFSLAAFGKFFMDFNGGNGADSYSSGTWDFAANTFTETTTPTLLCQGSAAGSPVTDVTANSQSDQFICAARKRNTGVVATNGELFLKGGVEAQTDGIEIHNAMAPNVSDPLPGATGDCKGVPATCTSPKLKYFRDPIQLPDVVAPCALTGAPNFPNAATGNALGGGDYCFTDVTLDQNTAFTGTPTNPTRIFLTGTLTVPKQNAVNFKKNAAGVVQPVPRPAVTLQIFSTGTGPSLKFGNHAAFAGAIYAPNAGFSGGSQGNVYGSLVAGSLNNNGGWNFHYDEALVGALGNAPLTASNWVEVGG